MQAIAWGGREIAYSLRFAANRSRLAITVHPDLRVTVVAPQGRTVKEVADRLRRRAGWVAKQLRQFERWHPLPTPRRYVPGESHLYLGRQYRLRLERGLPKVSVSSGRLVVRLPHASSTLRIQEIVDRWYVERAREAFARRLERVRMTTPHLAGPTVGIRVRRMRGRWGSCSPRGLVTLNPDLVKAPLSCIDYVLVHELCHSLVRNHSAKFWRLVAATMPDWQRRRDRLNSLRT